ncbi:MAG: hypothetical protein ABR964_03875 [Tepidisphaeraceae bacterium]
MTPPQAQWVILQRFGLRIEPEMAAYASRKIAESRDFALLGDDARTGLPRRQIVRPASLGADLSFPR